MRARAWAETLEVGRRGEAVLDAAFGPDYIIVQATAHHQRQGIDRFLVHRRDGRMIHRVDYKTDEAAGTTGNLAIEHTSVIRTGQRPVAGWIHTTVADRIVSYVPALDTAFVLEVPKLRKFWPAIASTFPPRIATTSGDRPYQTLVCCVPIAWLKSAGLVGETISTRNLQLRLPLTMKKRGGPPG